jgi:hypothetical protein
MTVKRDKNRCLICYKLLQTWKNTKLCNSYSLCKKLNFNDPSITTSANNSCCASSASSSIRSSRSNHPTPKSSLSSIVNGRQIQMDTISIDIDCDSFDCSLTRQDYQQQQQQEQMTISDLLEKLFNIKSSKSYKICEPCYQNLKFVYALWFNLKKIKSNLEQTYKKTCKLFIKRKQKSTYAIKTTKKMSSCTYDHQYQHEHKQRHATTTPSAQVDVQQQQQQQQQDEPHDLSIKGPNAKISNSMHLSRTECIRTSNVDNGGDLCPLASRRKRKSLVSPIST